jgi:hypothetical protein
MTEDCKEYDQDEATQGLGWKVGAVMLLCVGVAMVVGFGLGLGAGGC